MKRWILLFAGMAAVFAIGGFLVAASGLIPMKASSEHWPVTRWILRFSMQRSIATHSLGIDVPKLDNPALGLKGAAYYEIGCRSCHGAPGTVRRPIANSMMPQPPHLPPRIRESEPRKLFYVVKHGMKFTGMPAWPSQQRDDEVWAMVAFLMKLPELDEAGYRRLVHGEPAPTAPIQTREPLSEVSSPVVQSCARCHGQDGLGRGSGGFPKLAGQRAEYLANALDAYAHGKRHSGIMEPIAAGLNDGAIRQLTGYYAGLRVPSASAPEGGDDDAIARGRTIAFEGIPIQRVPSCVDCHGPGAKRGKPAYPALAGQSAAYLPLQLQLFKREQRGGSAYAHLMRPVATRLTDGQMGDVALYFESLAHPESGRAASPP